MREWSRSGLSYSTDGIETHWSARGLRYASKSARSKFEEAEHPRGPDGRFIKKGQRVRLADGGTGKVTGVDRSTGKVSVARDSGGTAKVSASQIAEVAKPGESLKRPQTAAQAKRPRAARPAEKAPTAEAPRHGARPEATRKLYHPESDSFYRHSLSEAKLDEADRKAVYDYAWDNRTYVQVNGALRGSEPMTPGVSRKIDALTSAIEKHTVKSPVIAHRLVQDTPRERERYRKAVRRTIQDDGFMSTSLDEGAIEDFADISTDGGIIMHIKVPLGAHGVYVGGMFDAEGGFDQKELILQRGGKLKITGVREREGRLHVDARLDAEIKPERLSETRSSPQTETPSPRDVLGREIKPGARVATWYKGFPAEAEVGRQTSASRVQIKFDDGHQRSVDASGLTVIENPGGAPFDDDLPYLKASGDLKPGDRFRSRRGGKNDGYVVTGEPSDKHLIKEFRDGKRIGIPGRDLDGNEVMLTQLRDERVIYYPPGVEMPGEKKRAEEDRAKPSTLKPGERFSFGAPGMHEPVYTVESISAPRKITQPYLNRKGEFAEKKLTVVDISMRTGDGQLVHGTFEDDGRAGIKHAAKPDNGPPYVPAKAVGVGDAVIDPEDPAGKRVLVVTAVTGEPHMYTGQYGYGGATHDSLLTLRDPDGKVRKIYNRSNWQGVRRASWKDAPPEIPPEPEPPKLEEVKPFPKGTPSVRPVLYTEDRQDILDMGFGTDSASPEALRQGVARIMARKEISAEQAAAMAVAIREHNNGPDIPPGKRRSTTRAAYWLDAAAAEIHGRNAPELEGNRAVVKSAPGDLTHGDTIALAGPGGEVQIAKVTSTKTNSWGVTTLGLEHPDGSTENRAVLSKSAVYVLPDLPPDAPEPPERLAVEHIHPERLRVGDSIRMNGVEHEVLKLSPDGSGVVIGEVRQVSSGAVFDDAEFYTPEDGLPSVARIRRGRASRDQPWDSVLPGDEDTDVWPTDVRVGARVTVRSPNLREDPVTGTVLRIQDVTSNTGSGEIVGTAFTVRDDEGRYVTRRMPNERLLTQHSPPEQNVVAQIERAERKRKLDAATHRTSMALHQFASEMYGHLANRARYGSDSEHMTLVELSEVRLDGPAKTAAKKLAEEIAPAGSDEQLIKAYSERLTPVLKEIGENVRTQVGQAIKEVQPGPDGDTSVPRYRLLSQYIDRPPSEPMAWESPGRTLAELQLTLAEEAPATSADLPEVPDLPEGADLTERINTYRRALPDGGAGVGKAPVRRFAFQTPTFAQLDNGQAPATEEITLLAKDRARDGGPGEIAMRQLDIVRAAGRDLRLELERRENALGGGEVASVEIRELEAELAENLRAGGEVWRVRGRIQEDLAREHGFDSYEALFNAYYDATGPESERLDRILKEISRATERPAKQRRRTAEDLQALKRTVADKRRQAALDLLRELRPGGLGSVEVDWTNPGTGKVMRRSPLVKAMKFAADSYPEEWVRAFDEHGRRAGGWSLGETDRGYYSDITREINLSRGISKTTSGGEYGDVAIHEMGHGMERAVPGLLEMEEALLWSRTSIGQIGERQREPLRPIYNNTKEWGYKNEFPEHYTGKDYQRGGDSHEVFTTSIESLLGGSEYLDDDLTEWTLGVLTLLGRDDPVPERAVEAPAVARPESPPVQAPPPAPKPLVETASIKNKRIRETADRALARVPRRLRDPKLKVITQPGVKRGSPGTAAEYRGDQVIIYEATFKQVMSGRVQVDGPTKGMSSQELAEWTLVHELGHGVMAGMWNSGAFLGRLGKDTLRFGPRAMRDAFNELRFVTGYSLTNADEAWAEAFMIRIHDPSRTFGPKSEAIFKELGI